MSAKQRRKNRLPVVCSGDGVMRAHSSGGERMIEKALFEGKPRATKATGAPGSSVRFWVRVVLGPGSCFQCLLDQAATKSKTSSSLCVCVCVCVRVCVCACVQSLETGTHSAAKPYSPESSEIPSGAARTNPNHSPNQLTRSNLSHA